MLVVNIKQQRQVSVVLVPIVMVVAVLVMAWCRGHQGWQFVSLVVALLLVDQVRPGRYLNHLVVHWLKHK